MYSRDMTVLFRCCLRIAGNTGPYAGGTLEIRKSQNSWTSRYAIRSRTMQATSAHGTISVLEPLALPTTRSLSARSSQKEVSRSGRQSPRPTAGSGSWCVDFSICMELYVKCAHGPNHKPHHAEDQRPHFLRKITYRHLARISIASTLACHFPIRILTHQRPCFSRRMISCYCKWGFMP